MIRALIFDFDGLILDTESPSLRIWRELYCEHGCAFPEHLWHQRVGAAVGAVDLYQHLQELAGRTLDLAALRHSKRERSLALIKSQAPQPGVQACLAEARARGLRLGVASSSPHDWVEGHLERLGLLGHFDAIRCAEDVGAAKPDPAVYRAVLAALQVRPDEAIAFEDSPNGVGAARAAGIYCVAVPNEVTRAMDFRHACRMLDSLADVSLTQLLAAVALSAIPE